MDFKVIFMKRAARDMEQIVARIAKDNPDAALRLGDELIDEALSPVQFPEPGSVVPEFGDPTIRQLILGNYRIIYRLRKMSHRLSIIRFWHSARGTPAI